MDFWIVNGVVEEIVYDFWLVLLFIDNMQVDIVEVEWYIGDCEDFCVVQVFVVFFDVNMFDVRDGIYLYDLFDYGDIVQVQLIGELFVV